jgi:hypothetical protein
MAPRGPLTETALNGILIHILENKRGSSPFLGVFAPTVGLGRFLGAPPQLFITDIARFFQERLHTHPNQLIKLSPSKLLVNIDQDRHPKELRFKLLENQNFI